MNREIVQVVILSLIFLSCKKINKSGTYCGFSFEKLEPQSSCIKGLKVTAKYSKNKLEHLNFRFNDILFKEDTLFTMVKSALFYRKYFWSK